MTWCRRDVADGHVRLGAGNQNATVPVKTGRYVPGSPRPLANIAMENATIPTLSTAWTSNVSIVTRSRTLRRDGAGDGTGDGTGAGSFFFSFFGPKIIRHGALDDTNVNTIFSTRQYFGTVRADICRYTFLFTIYVTSIHSISIIHFQSYPMSVSVASRYKKLDQREHVLHRPDTYVGSLAPAATDVWLSEKNAMIKRSAFISPALLKIFDEILVNAADSYARNKSMTTLKVTMTDYSVTIFNDGASIPIDMHPTEKCHVPELIFGHLLAGENFDDSEDRFGGGRNGYGAKLTNIFSKAFHVDIADGTKKYKQTWTHNMSKRTKPKITSCAKKPYVSITFEPDFGMFGTVAFDADHVALFRRRVHDTAAILGKDVKVTFAANFTGMPWLVDPTDNKRTIKTFGEYVKAFAIPGVVIGDAIAIAKAPNGEFEHMSFVNGVWTPRGGTHVNAVMDALSRSVVEAALKKKVVIKPSTVKNHVFVFVNASVVNPTFDTQSKEYLTSKLKIPMDDVFIKKAVASVLDSVIAEAVVKASLVDERTLKKTDGVKRARIDGIPKLTDANWAGTYRSDACTLILTEGDSAKSLAIAGLSVVGRDTYGVFPLRGKLLNVRDASTSSIANNAEIAALKQILGLQTGRSYTDAKSLRYGHVMVMTDADTDGSHISGLVVNFFHACFPSLLKIPGFFQSFITPVVRAKKHNVTLSFYSLPELDAWKSQTPNHSTWTLKFYKVRRTSFHTSRTPSSHADANTKLCLHERRVLVHRPRPKLVNISRISPNTSRPSCGLPNHRKPWTKRSRKHERQIGANGFPRSERGIISTTPSHTSRSMISWIRN